MAPTSIRALYGISDTRNATHGSGKVTFCVGLRLAKKKKTWHHLVIRSELKPKPVECSGAQAFRRCWRSWSVTKNVCSYQWRIVCDWSKQLERFSCDLEMIARKQKRNSKRTEIERFDWLIERIQTPGEKSSFPRTF